MKNLLSIILLSVISYNLPAQKMEAAVAQVKDKVIEWRRHIHQNPELSFKETQTADYVAGILKSFGNIEVKRPAKTSVLGILKGAKQGKTVAFRADMDALPVPEETGLPYASKVALVMPAAMMSHCHVARNRCHAFQNAEGFHWYRLFYFSTR